MLKNLLALHNFTSNTFITLTSGYHPFVHSLMNGIILSQYLDTGQIFVSVLLIPSKKQSFLIRASSASTIAGSSFSIPTFLSQGFGYAVCQPGTNVALEVSMVAYCSGSDFVFMTKESSAVIHPVAFGGQRCRRNEVRLHSHLGEGFASDWGINILFGQQFVCVIDCYAI
jgi:hypothetical protein